MSLATDLPPGGAILERVHHLPVRIYYEDTDFSGMVYHANYVRYFERGRSDFLRLSGMSHADLMALQSPLAFTIEHISLDFAAPARIDDLIIVRTVYAEMKGARLRARQDIRRAGQLLARAEVHAACISFEGRPRRLPPELRARLKTVLRPDLPEMERVAG
ncbi:MAG: tol-pal system-associated acyl-CoA thioesterase [Alphaproteobacteria bacterium]|nr:tol-pal system-associated acyl-CoA thioesterase [Alphaproteobacteria bacterium]